MSSPTFTIRVEGSQPHPSQSKVVYTRGEKCGIENCRSKKYHEEAGKVFCSHGHEQQNVTRTQGDEDDFGSQGRKTRRKREVRERVSRIYRGHKALGLYLQSYQIILWKQCHCLVHRKGFPTEFESVVRDLWALRLQFLSERVTASSNLETESRKIISSQDEAKSESEVSHDEGPESKARRFEKPPALIETLGICYLAAILLRLPLSVGDLHSWAIQEDIPFIRAIRFVPNIMREKLPSEYIAALDTLTPLRPNKLCAVVNKLVHLYRSRFDMTFPNLNHPLLLFKHIRNLSLPIEVYTTTQQLSSLLSISFSFPTPDTLQSLTLVPEIQLLALLIIAIKLHHPFDSKPRFITSLTDPGTLTVDWPTWCQTRNPPLSHSAQQPDENPALSPAAAIRTTEFDIFDMDADQMDSYLNWYEKTYVVPTGPPRSSRKLPQQLLDMFPTAPLPPPPSSPPPPPDHHHRTTSRNIHQTQSHLRTRDLVSSRAAESASPPLRVGQEYKRYRKVERLDRYARPFYEEVARLGGVDVETMVRAVLGLERRLVGFGKESGEDEDGE